MRMATADFLRGEIVLSRGTTADYRELSHLHYVPGHPAVATQAPRSGHHHHRAHDPAWQVHHHANGATTFHRRT